MENGGYARRDAYRRRERMDTFSREEILKMNKAQMDTFMDNQLRMSQYNETVSQGKQDQIDDLILTLSGDLIADDAGGEVDG